MHQELSLHQQIWNQLQQVSDPEITSISIVEMGMVEGIELSGKAVTVRMLPTYIGCPALNMIKEEVANSVSEIRDIEDVHVEFQKDPIWTSERITPEGRERLKECGIAPPPLEPKQAGVWEIECPYCSSPKTVMDNVFGPAACRSIFYCNSCKNPFEAIKPV